MPIRTCVGCRERLEQAELIRVHATGHGLTTGPGPGRGAYLCPNRACFDAAVRHNSLSRALRIAADADQVARLSTSWPSEPVALPPGRH